MNVRGWTLATVAAFALVVSAPSFAADVPAAMKEILSSLKLDESILSGLDKELDVPQAWVDGARKEGTFRITGSWDPSQFTAMTKPFIARYPYIKPAYSRGSFNDRALRPIIAYHEGRYIADIVSGIGGAMPRYAEADALDDIRVLPSANNVIDGMKAADGRWIGIRIRYWCMSYNTTKISKADLPATWEDLLTNPKWRDGHLALANLPQLWVLPLWAKHGDDWAKNYLQTLFHDVKPQIRKEGSNAVLSLVMAGEFSGAIPSADYRLATYAKKGAPVGWHCPTPVPSAISEMAILKGNPNINASHIFANWLLSKERHIAQFHADNAITILIDLQIGAFLSFPEEIAGKEIAFRDPELEDENDKMLAIWNPLWGQAR